MIRTTPPRRRGRPLGPAPLFLDDCVLRFDATELLPKSRDAPFTRDDLTIADRYSSWTVQSIETKTVAANCSNVLRYLLLRVPATVNTDGTGGLSGLQVAYSLTCTALTVPTEQTTITVRERRIAAPDEGTRHRILVENPERLYGFTKSR